MKFSISSYKSSIILILSIIIGGIIGVFFKDLAIIIKPLGDLFLNLLFMTLPLLIFFSITSSFIFIDKMSRLNDILKYSLIVFIFTALISSFIAVISIIIYNPIKGLSLESFKNLEINSENIITNPQSSFSLASILEKIPNIFTTNDFYQILSMNNILPLIVFSILFGVCLLKCNEKYVDKCQTFNKFIDEGNRLTLEFINLIMKFAPIGLGAYFANVVLKTGTQIFEGYLKIFVLYIIVAFVTYFVIFTIYSYLAGGIEGIKLFWQNVLPPSIMALSSCSSVASLPTNINATKKMKVPQDVLNISLPLGVNVHKDGSVIGNVFKIAFLFTLLGQDFNSIYSILLIVSVATISSIVVGAIPSGGVMGEIAILSLFSMPQELLPLILVISTIIDAPATLLNSVGNTCSSMMVARLVDGKNWYKR